MRDPGPARSSSALLCSTGWLNAQPPNYREQSRAAGHLSLHPKPPSSLARHSFLWLCEQKIQEWLRNLHVDPRKCSISFISSLPLSSRCTPVFVFCHEEASAASPSARLFLKDMRSYPAQPFPFPANPNKAGMLRERLRALCFELVRS